MYVGLISDTHGVFGEEFKEFLAPVDVIWHAGDFGGGASFAEEIASFKPVVGVSGNCDGQDIRLMYPSYQLLQVQGLKILMTHIGGSPGHYDVRARALIDRFNPKVFICGHSHILKIMNDGDMLYLNPGAAGIQGWHVVRTALRFKILDGVVQDMEVFNLPRENHNY